MYAGHPPVSDIAELLFNSYKVLPTELRGNSEGTQITMAMERGRAFSTPPQKRQSCSYRDPTQGTHNVWKSPP